MPLVDYLFRYDRGAFWMLEFELDRSFGRLKYSPFLRFCFVLFCCCFVVVVFVHICFMFNLYLSYYHFRWLLWDIATTERLFWILRNMPSHFVRQVVIQILYSLFLSLIVLFYFVLFLSHIIFF